jgi:hypothetical protein
MIVIKNVEKIEDVRYSTWETTLSRRAKEVVLDCLEAGLESYEEDGDTEGVSTLNGLINLFKKEDNDD